ncbi:MAG: ATP-binding cassette domain-containing protein [Candidatus Cloacimonadota bacterium]|nr:ATP-binding cassette domain-containing protein [Candidatus Cloacimonadota bacterium]
MKFTKENIRKEKIEKLLIDYPFLQSFFDENNLDITKKESLSLQEYFSEFDEDKIEDNAIDIELYYLQISEFINQMVEFLGQEEDKVQMVTILPGTDKSGNKEKFDKLEIKQGEIICIVGPTGSGKSRLLGDIEWVAQSDTPTSRTVLINNEIPDKKWRFSSSDKLVAQLSQNMNFVMDLSVYEFVELHTESRLIENKKEIINRIIKKANDLAGEAFAPDIPITSLSGGQSRALMIADTAILSKSPIILIDEIENAGIDRKRALNLLLSEDKIVLMATHDPILALMGDKRIVIKNGGIHKVIETTNQEREILSTLEEMDKTLLSYRTKLRSGEMLNRVD